MEDAKKMKFACTFLFSALLIAIGGALTSGIDAISRLPDVTDFFTGIAAISTGYAAWCAQKSAHAAIKSNQTWKSQMATEFKLNELLEARASLKSWDRCFQRFFYRDDVQDARMFLAVSHALIKSGNGSNFAETVIKHIDVLEENWESTEVSFDKIGFTETDTQTINRLRDAHRSHIEACHTYKSFLLGNCADPERLRGCLQNLHSNPSDKNEEYYLGSVIESRLSILNDNLSVEINRLKSNLIM